jgi:polysaccharide export outer membrane protein
VTFKCWWRRRLVITLTIFLASVHLVYAQGATSRSDADIRPPSAASVISGSSGSLRSPAGYVIGAGDVLAINVYNEPEVTGKVPVRPDGMISVPLLGDLQAGGLTPDRLQTSIAQKLTEFVKQPSVTVVVEEMNSRQFNVLGQVQHPGSFSLTRPTRVLDAVAQAGGFGEFAKTGKIYVLRRDPGGATIKLPFDYKRVSQGRDVGSNVELQAGDTVIVP